MGHLVTSGCSFTDKHTITWANHLADALGHQLYNTGMGCQGNGLIARKALYQTQLLLNRGMNSDNILVGIMWSGPDRMDWFIDNPPELPNIDNWITGENPHTFITGAPGGWVLGNHHWENKWSKDYYQSRYCNIIAHQIKTYEQIILAQSYLQSKNIKYFMTTYTGNVFLDSDKTDPNITWMRNLIDWDRWLPVDGCLEWCYGKQHGVENYNGMHPTRLHHKLFAEQVIVPFLSDTIRKTD